MDSEWIQNCQRSRVKLRTCQDSAAIPAFDKGRTETLTTCHNMLRCTTTSSDVDLQISQNSINYDDLRNSTRIHDNQDNHDNHDNLGLAWSATSASGLSARKTIRFGAAQWLKRAPRTGKTPSLTERLQTCNLRQLPRRMQRTDNKYKIVAVILKQIVSTVLQFRITIYVTPFQGF